MKFEFSEEQELMRTEARRFLQRECTSTAVRSVLQSDLGFHAPLWTAVSKMGWTGVALPEEYGGLGAGYLELCVIAEELGRALAPIPFSSTIFLAAECLLRLGDGAQRKRWLPKLAAGEIVGTMALGEGGGAASWNRTQTIARASGLGTFRLSGIKWPVCDGTAADIAIVPANGPDGFGLYLVQLNQAGVQRIVEPGLDESRPQGRLQFNDATAERLSGATEKNLQDVLNRAAVLYAFEQLGGADACLQMAVAYAKERYAFGRPIGSFQAIKHRLADLYSELELARSNCFFAAWALATNDPALAEAAACARLAISRSYFNCAKESIQIHGGIGFTWEFDAHLYYRRAKLLSVVIGGEGRWREYLVRVLEDKLIASGQAVLRRIGEK